MTKELKSRTIRVVHKNEEAKTKDEKGETGGDSSAVVHSPYSNNSFNWIVAGLSKTLAGLTVAPLLLTKSIDTIVAQNNEQRKFNQNFYIYT